MLRNMFIGAPPGNTGRILDDPPGPPPLAAGEPAIAEPAADAPPHRVDER